MKKAQLEVVVFMVLCPHCGQSSLDPVNDSHMWEIDEVLAGQTYPCTECGEVFELPRVVKWNQLRG